MIIRRKSFNNHTRVLCVESEVSSSESTPLEVYPEERDRWSQLRNEQDRGRGGTCLQSTYPQDTSFTGERGFHHG